VPPVVIRDQFKIRSSATNHDHAMFPSGSYFGTGWWWISVLKERLNRTLGFIFARRYRTYCLGIPSRASQDRPMESSYEFDVSVIIERELDQKVAPLVGEEIQQPDNHDEAIRVFRGVFFATLFSIPIWFFILWIVF
jgi:hypothetical protein